MDRRPVYLKYNKPRASGHKLRLEKQSGIKSFQASLATVGHMHFTPNVMNVDVGSAVVIMPLWKGVSIMGESCACVGTADIIS